jgi:hypothetical protein
MVAFLLPFVLQHKKHSSVRMSGARARVCCRPGRPPVCIAYHCVRMQLDWSGARVRVAVDSSRSIARWDRTARTCALSAHARIRTRNELACLSLQHTVRAG